MNTHDTFVTIDDKSLFVRTWQPDEPAEKTPIILFHDSLGCVDLWRGFPEALCNATQRTVIAYDRYGYGKSSANPTPQPLDFVSQEAEIYVPALSEQLNISKFIAFGHSVGGGMAVHCAAKYPDVCEALITEAAQAFVEERTLAGIREAKDMFAAPINVDRLKKYHGEKAQWVLDAWIETWLSSGFADWSLRDVLPQVQCPVLTIHGDDDEYGSLAHPNMIVEGVSGDATLKVMQGCKHVPHREDESTVLEAVVGFLGG